MSPNIVLLLLLLWWWWCSRQHSLIMKSVLFFQTVCNLSPRQRCRTVNSLVAANIYFALWGSEGQHMFQPCQSNRFFTTGPRNRSAKRRRERCTGQTKLGCYSLRISNAFIPIYLHGASPRTLNSQQVTALCSGLMVCREDMTGLIVKWGVWTDHNVNCVFRKQESFPTSIKSANFKHDAKHHWTD